MFGPLCAYDFNLPPKGAAMKTYGSTGSAFRMEFSGLPTTHVEKGSKIGGLFIVFFSLLWGGIPSLILLNALVQGTFEPMMTPLLIFTVIGLGIFLLGLWQATRVQTTRIDEHTVSVDTRWVFGHRLWSEPKSRYEGVLSRSEWHSGGKNSSSYTLHVVELWHPDNKKRIRLYASRSDEGLRKIREGYCRSLNMPALEGDGPERTVRDVEDLDKSVRDLVEEGKLAVNFDPVKQPPPRGIGIETLDDQLRLTLPTVRIPIGILLLGLGLPGTFIYFGFFKANGPIGLGVVGALILLAVVAGYIWSQVAQAVVEVGPDRVRAFYKTPWGETPSRSVSASEIENIRIGRKTEGRGQPGVLLATDRTTVAIAEGRSAAMQEWLKNCIMAVIVR
jgi:hypothetical protein